MSKKKPTPLDGCHRKLKRARRKLDQLEGEITRWKATKPWEAVQEPHAEASLQLLRVELRELPDPEWALEVGEAMGQARSALDHLVQQLVTANGHNPTGSHQFPIHRSEKHFKARKIAGVDPRWKAEIKSLQPYNLGSDVANHPLFRLNALTQFDKHTDIHPIAVGLGLPVDGDAFEIQTGPNFQAGWIDMLMFPFGNEPVDGATFAGAHFENFDPGARFDLDAVKIRFDVRFGPAQVTTREMHDLIKVVRKILARFEPAFV